MNEVVVVRALAARAIKVVLGAAPMSGSRDHGGAAPMNEVVLRP